MIKQKYLIGKWTPDLTDPCSDWYPLGIVARKGRRIELRLAGLKTIPTEYRSFDPVTKVVFDNMEQIFRETKRSSQNPCNLYFIEIETDLNGDLGACADRLYEVCVAKYYVDKK